MENNHTVAPVTDGSSRKQVPREERIAIARAIKSVLDARDESGRKIWSQFSIGQKLGVSQESARRALAPGGVGPAIRDGIENLMGMSVERIVEKFGGEAEEPEHDVIDAALLQLIYEKTEYATEYAEAAKEIRVYSSPEKMTVDIAKRQILSQVASNRGKSVGEDILEDADEGLLVKKKGK